SLELFPRDTETGRPRARLSFSWGSVRLSTSSVGGTYEPTVPGGESVAGAAAGGSQGARQPARDRQGTVAGTGFTARAVEVGTVHQRGTARADRRAQSIRVERVRDDGQRRADGHSTQPAG